MRGEEKGRTGWHREAASQQTSSRHRIGPIPQAQAHRLPAYGRALVDAQQQGQNVPWLCISLDWNLGRALPRVVIAATMPVHELDMRVVAGLDCLVAHRGETHRALDVAEAALMAGATRCAVYDAATGKLTATTCELMAARGMRAAA